MLTRTPSSSNLIYVTTGNPNIEIRKCKLCGNEWANKLSQGVSTRCPKCNSRRWNQEPNLVAERQRLVNALARFDHAHPEVRQALGAGDARLIEENRMDKELLEF